MEQVKKTSVQWLIQNIVEDQTIKSKSMSEWIKVFDNAKAMEKEQIMDAHKHGFTEGTCFGSSPIGYKFTTSEQYYNETYGK